MYTISEEKRKKYISIRF